MFYYHRSYNNLKPCRDSCGSHSELGVPKTEIGSATPKTSGVALDMNYLLCSWGFNPFVTKLFSTMGQVSVFINHY